MYTASGPPTFSPHPALFSLSGSNSLPASPFLPLSFTSASSYLQAFKHFVLCFLYFSLLFFTPLPARSDVLSPCLISRQCRLRVTTHPSYRPHQLSSTTSLSILPAPPKSTDCLFGEETPPKRPPVQNAMASRMFPLPPQARRRNPC